MKTSGNKILWRKAAVLGSLWAASEIVLGSFLHNAHIPFSGEFLTAVGIAILVAGHRLWPEPGLLWRAGLICAAMKSVSPSAVIFGPMISISAEGFLAEAGVLLLGANAGGYLLAGGLAMLGTLAYKLIKLFMIYGPDTISVYLRGVEWLRGLGFGAAGAWAPLAAASAAYFIAGGGSALAGILAAKVKNAPQGRREAGGTADARGVSRTGPRRYSLLALSGHIVFVAGVLAAGRAIPETALTGMAGLYGYACYRFYPRARGLLRRGGLWAGVLAASLTAGLVLGSLSAGLYMALRAFVMTISFSAIGEELLNPVMRRALELALGAVFFETLEYAFASLPGIIADLPSGRDFITRPLASLGGTVARAPFLLDPAGDRKIFIITGPHGSGKSEMIAELAELMRSAGKRPGGILAEGFWENGVRAGFNLRDLSNGKKTPLCRRGAIEKIKAGEFGFFESGLKAGLAALSTESVSEADVVFIDEVGFLELEGGGWASQLRTLLGGSGAPLAISVRDYLLENVKDRWNLRPVYVWKAGEIRPEAAFEQLLSSISLVKSAR